MDMYAYRHVVVDVVCEDGAELPLYAIDGDACADIKAYLPDGPVTLKPGERKLIKSGIRVKLPDMYEIQVRPRSGLAYKYGVTVLNSPGTIDAGYTGDIGVILINLGDSDFTVNHGDRIAQMAVKPVHVVDWRRVSTLETTERGAGGFGHTGV